MTTIRVLIVDDAVVIRRLVTDVLSSEPGIEVVGTAANGRIALQKIPQCNPDLVTLDVEMPDMDGLETLRAIRKTYPRLPVIMFSTLTARGATETLDALTHGASDYVTKPANVGSVTAGLQRVREDLVPKIRALVGVPAPHGEARPLTPAPTPGHEPASPPARVIPAPRPAAMPAGRRAPGSAAVSIVAIGVSTGGPNALAAILPTLPASFPVPIVITQHMPPMFTKLLAERLDAGSGIRVCEAAEGMALEPGTAYIAPGDYHLTLVKSGHRTVVHLTQDPPENSCRPAVDPMFRSVAALYRSGAVGVVLTGMGQDGLRGAEHLRAAGAVVLAQDEATSVVWGMPGFVARAGLADRVLPVGEIGPELNRWVGAACRPDVLAPAAGASGTSVSA